MSESEFILKFSGERECRNFFKKIIDQKGACCHNCKSQNVKWKEELFYWRCQDCRSKTTIKSLCFMKNSKASYKEWLHAIYYLLNVKKPLSTKQLQKKLDSKHYKKVYYLAMKIRLEIAKQSKGFEYLKYKLITQEEVKDYGDKKLHLIPKGARLFICKQGRKKIIRFQLSKKEQITVQKAKSAKENTYSFPKLINLQIFNDFPEELNIRSVSTVFSDYIDDALIRNANRIIDGIHHGTSCLHLQLYLDEFTYKFNFRKSSESIFEIFLSNIDFGNYRPT